MSATPVRSYYDSKLVGVYSVVPKRVHSVSGYTAVFKIEGHCTVYTVQRTEGFDPILG